MPNLWKAIMERLTRPGWNESEDAFINDPLNATTYDEINPALVYTEEYNDLEAWNKDGLPLASQLKSVTTPYSSS